jgi:hypothetical protein
MVPPDIEPALDNLRAMAAEERKLDATVSQAFDLMRPVVAVSRQRQLRHLETQAREHLGVIQAGLKRNEEYMGELFGRHIEALNELEKLKRLVSGAPDPLDHPDFAAIRTRLKNLEMLSERTVLRDALAATIASLNMERHSRRIMIRYLALLVIAPVVVVLIAWMTRVL